MTKPFVDANLQCVSTQGMNVVVLAPKQRMTAAEALVHAAWLVALADSVRGEDDPTFEQALEAVRGT